MILFVLLISLLAGPVWSNVDEDEQLETVLAVTQCRASCLDQFSYLIRNEENCMIQSNCFMCWEMCKMVMESFEIWGPICLVPDVCPAGCQLACNFMESEKNDSDSPPSILMVRNVYEPHTDRVSVEWVPDRDLESEGAVLYSVLLKDEKQPWNQIAQTTSHVVHIKRGLLGLHSEIRVIAANATKQVSDSKTAYVESHDAEAYLEGLTKNTRNLWKPHLETLIENGLGLQATIVWPAKQYENEPMLYEVSWSVTDDTIEITGHLHTTNNAAILTLWPNSLYSVQVSCLGVNKTLRSQSEPLVIDTKSSQMNKEIEKISAPSCTKGSTTAMNAFAVISAFFLTIIIVTIIWVVKIKRKNLLKTDVCKVESVIDYTTPFHVKMPEISYEQEQMKTDDELANFHLI